MKKRSSKVVVALILAMTMLMGMSMTVMAEGPGKEINFLELKPGDTIKQEADVTIHWGSDTKHGVIFVLRIEK